ncbi:MAG: hypothetical protein NVV60_05750 [Luteimonas sp.]|nr:hypothetical protein [Luteimonas sp.]
MNSTDYWSGAAAERMSNNREISEWRALVQSLEQRLAEAETALTHERMWSSYYSTLRDIGYQERERMAAELQRIKSPVQESPQPVLQQKLIDEMRRQGIEVSGLGTKTVRLTQLR